MGGSIMSKNDPTQDRYDPPGVGNTDFEKMVFSDLDVYDLFWQTDQPGDNIPWRKVTDTQGMNLRARTTHNFEPRTVVFQKT